MATKTYATYEEATQDYLDRFRALRDTPPEKAKEVTRGAGDIPADTLITRAEEIADVSPSIVPLAQGYLNSPDPVDREGISGQLLAQTGADLQLATELFQIAASEAASPAEAAKRAPREATRAVRGVQLRDAIDRMEKVMVMPVSAGLITAKKVRRATPPTEPGKAKEALIKTAGDTTDAITTKVVDDGGKLAFTLVFETNWANVSKAAALSGVAIETLLNRIKEGAGVLIRRAVTTAIKIVLSAYDKILALLGKDVEGEARKKIKAWLDKMKEDGKIALFKDAVDKLFQVDKFKNELPGCLQKAEDVDKINATTKDVEALSEKFTTLAGSISKVGAVLGLAKFLAVNPQILLVVTSIRVALLAVLVYGGYDYIGYGQSQYANITMGVSEVITGNLCPKK